MIPFSGMNNNDDDNKCHLKITVCQGLFWASQLALVVKNPPASAGGMRWKFDLWVWKIPQRREWNPLQYSCLENPVDRRAWWATVQSITQSGT